MRVRSVLPFVLSLCLFLSGCSDRATPPCGNADRLSAGNEDNGHESEELRYWEMPSGSDVVRADNDFGFRLFRDLVNDKPDSNIVISPLSVSIALGMTVNGAAGQTFVDMQTTLGLAGYSLEGINECYEAQIDFLTNLDPYVQFDIANSVWCRDGVPFKQPFLDACYGHFDAQARNLDFSLPDASDTMNAWVADHTNNKITEIVPEHIDPLTMIILLNAIYFNGAWAHPFATEFTRDGGFRLPDGTIRTCRMMCRPDTGNCYTHLTSSKFNALDMAYGDSLFSMTVFLPKGGHSTESVVADFNNTNWGTWMSGFTPWYGAMQLPRFEVEYSLRMDDVLAAMGMGIIFEPAFADFTRMCTCFSDFYIQAVRHKTYIRVDEVGTEAAAVTEVEGGPTSIPPQFYVTKPFVFVIRENQRNTILFIGQITNPGYFTD